MKNIIQLAFLSCILFSSSCSAEYQHRTGKNRDLDSVVREFNEKYPDIQALTKEEVKAAVNAMRYNKDESFDEVYPYFEKTVTENLITDGVYISYKDIWYKDGIRYDIELISICYETSKKEQRSEMAGSYSHWIRNKFIDSRPMTEKEQRVYQGSSYMIASPKGNASNKSE